MSSPDAIASEDQVRVCPSIRSRKGEKIILSSFTTFLHASLSTTITILHYAGWVWTNEKYTGGNWMLDVTFKVSGRLRNGADGMVMDDHLFC